jgi:hypothetical protein
MRKAKVRRTKKKSRGQIAVADGQSRFVPVGLLRNRLPACGPSTTEQTRVEIKIDRLLDADALEIRMVGI